LAPRQDTLIKNFAVLELDKDSTAAYRATYKEDPFQVQDAQEDMKGIFPRDVVTTAASQILAISKWWPPSVLSSEASVGISSSLAMRQ
jgi:hypothetical protein